MRDTNRKKNVLPAVVYSFYRVSAAAAVAVSTTAIISAAYCRYHSYNVYLFCVKANTNTGCLFGKEAPKKNGKPYVQGISSGLVEAMKTNLRIIPGVKWQYYGNKQGVMYSFPAKSSCHRSTFDPRLRLTLSNSV